MLSSIQEVILIKNIPLWVENFRSPLQHPLGGYKIIISFIHDDVCVINTSCQHDWPSRQIEYKLKEGPHVLTIEY